MSSPASATTRALVVPELLLEIFAHLGPADLAATALVSRQWTLSAQVGLYCHVQFVVNPSAAPEAGPLVRTLSARPELGARVRALDFVFGLRAKHERAWTDMYYEDDAKVLLQCPELERLSLPGERALGRPSPLRIWPLTDLSKSGGNGPVMGQLIALSAVHASHITHLTITSSVDYVVVAPYLPAFTGLTSLSLSNCDVLKHDFDWPKPTFTLRRLFIGLSFHKYQTAVDVAFASLTYSSRASLRHLTLDGYSNGILHDICEWGGSLLTLDLIVWLGTADDIAGDFRPARLAALRRMTVTVGPANADVFVPDLVHEFVAKLERGAAEVNAELGRKVVHVAKQGAVQWAWR